MTSYLSGFIRSCFRNDSDKRGVKISNVKIVGVRPFLGALVVPRGFQGRGEPVHPFATLGSPKNSQEKMARRTHDFYWSSLCTCSSSGLEIGMYQLVFPRASIWYIICLCLVLFTKKSRLSRLSKMQIWFCLVLCVGSTGSRN